MRVGADVQGNRPRRPWLKTGWRLMATGTVGALLFGAVGNGYTACAILAVVMVVYLDPNVSSGVRARLQGAVIGLLGALRNDATPNSSQERSDPGAVLSPLEGPTVFSGADRTDSSSVSDG